MQLHLPYQLLLLSLLYASLMGYVSSGYTFSRAPHITMVSLVLLLVGLLLGLWAKKTIFSHRTTLNPYGTPSTLVVSGPFRFSRNPMYLSYVCVVFAVSIYAHTILAYLAPLLYVSYLHYHIIPFEEKNLVRLFPSEYPAYAKTVRKWL